MMGTMRRIQKIERAAGAVDWHAHLPEGITVGQAEAFLETWARLAADYANDHGVSGAEAIDATTDAVIALVESSQTPGDEDDDEL
jgi:hypothetical protein